MNSLAELRWHRESRCPAAQRQPQQPLLSVATPVHPMVIVNAPVVVEPMSRDR